MIFNYIKKSTLPKLGWCMVINKNNQNISVYSGEYVETFSDWFVSGVWDDDFSSANFENAHFLCGTAVKIKDDVITVYSPTHERQRFCYIKYDDKIIFSNSIPLLLAMSGEKFDVDYHNYEEVLCGILKGTKDYPKEIPLSDNKVMVQVFCADISVDLNLKLTYTRKPIHRDFVDYNDYLSSLCQMCEKVRDNGLDCKRSHKYSMVSTASSGYDSSTCAAIAKMVGCDTLLTFKGGYYNQDSAVEIGKKLGYKTIIERGHKDFKVKLDCIDAEFFVCGDLGAYLQFSAFENDFAGNIVFSGTSGSYIWDKDSNVNIDSVRYNYNYYTANLSFAENALKNGYVFFPLPLYGSTAVESIQRITNSEEMKPWTLNTSYDRPICRRVLETSGVDRNMFGHTKYGGGFSLARNFTKRQIKPKMSIEGYKSFCKWLKVKGNNRWTLNRVFKMIQYHFATIPDYTAYVLKKLGFNVVSHAVISYPNPGLPSKLIIWGMEVVTNKYVIALENN